MKHREASMATRRFGLGPRPGDTERLAADPRGYVLAALQRKDGAVIADPELEPGHVSLTSLRAMQKAQTAERKNAKVANEATPSAATAMSAGQMPAAEVKAEPKAEAPRPGAAVRDVFREEAGARLARATSTDQPFLERLVMFWSNHFAISAIKGPAVRVQAGAFEREAIRPHVLGRFADMLKAVEQHPAMLIYLDNAQSMGPNPDYAPDLGKSLAVVVQVARFT